MSIIRLKKVCFLTRTFFCIIMIFLLSGKALALNATDTIRAESFSGQSGVTTEPCSEGGQNVTSIENGDIIFFEDIDFGDSGIQCFEARVASNGNGGFIELRLDSLTGRLIGTCEILPPTGSWQTWTNKTCAISGVTGIHTLNLVFREGTGPYPISKLFNLNWFKFHGTPALLTTNWRQSTNAKKGVWKTPITLSDTSDATPVIRINPDSMYQRVDGWGGAFNENGYHCISSLPAGLREAVLRELFDPVTGCRFNMGRVPIGMSDFTVNKVYSLNETPGDYAMEHFSLHNDSLMNMAYVKEAMAVNPDIMIYASPWTPPTWMKSNNSWEGGGNPTINQNDRTYTAYALYFSKFVKGWKGAGIPVNIVYPQNEPGWNNQNHPSCYWNPTALKNWVRDYLYPKFIADTVDAQIWMGTFHMSQYIADLQPTLDDPKARAMMTGIGVQRLGDQALSTATLNTYYRDLHYHSMQTETMCWYGENSWTNAMDTYERIHAHEKAGCQSYNMWNMILDPDSMFVKWMPRNQNSMISIVPATQTVRYNPEFYVMKHWSHYIRVGAVRVLCTNSNNNLRALAFKNPDGTIILELQNNASGTVSPLIRLDAKEFTPAITGSSVNTFIIGGTEEARDWVPATGLTCAPAVKPVIAGKDISGVYDIMGRSIKVDDYTTGTGSFARRRSGRRNAAGGNAAPGLYIVRKRTGGTSIIRKELRE